MRKRLYATFAVLGLAACWFACSGDDPYDGRPPGWCHREGDPCSSDDECCRYTRGDPQCGAAVCDKGVCSVLLVSETKSQRRGDCEVIRCNPEGHAEPESSETDVPDDGNPCTRDICDNLNQPGNVNVVRGPAPGGSGFCDGEGHLVECALSADCNDPSLVCSENGKCIPPSCQNRAFDPSLGETDKDCGGRCDPCYEERQCNSGEDCVSGVCRSDKRCALGHCDDGVKNGNETDVDCGGTCGVVCDEGEGCWYSNDCASYSCFAGTCHPPTCEDSIKNGDEIGEDCGGRDCPPCE
jgi:hypothetical protein